MNWNESIKEHLLKTAPATYGHFPGVNFMSPRIKPVRKDLKVAGPAYTISMGGCDSSVLYEAINLAAEGSVLVIDRKGDNTYACVGEFVALSAMVKKIAGIIIDGPATDVLALEEMDIPVFCTGISPVTTSVWGISGSHNIPIQCGGAQVKPGDIILGDADGVVVLPDEDIHDILQKALEKTEEEEKKREAYRKGLYEVPSVKSLMEADIPELIRKIRFGKDK